MFKPKTVLLIYCLMFSLFVTISGLVSSQNPQSSLLQLIFLPIPVYLAFALFKQFRASKKHSEESSSPILEKRSPKKVIFVFLCLGILIALSVIKIQNSSGQKSLETKSQSQIQTTSTPQIQNPNTASPSADTNIVLLITTEYPNELINIRQEPTTSSKIISKASLNQRFLSTSTKNGWYEIILEDGKKGWVSQKYVMTPKSNNR